MIASELKRYPAYKDSGVEWLREVPEHWEVRELRQVLRSVTERNRPDLPLLSVVREKGVILRDLDVDDDNHNFVPDDLSNYKVVRSGQLAVNKMKAWQGSYGVSGHDGIVSPAYFVFGLRDAAADYLHLALRSKAYVPFFAAASEGVRIGQWDLSPQRMREIPFLVPPSFEQTTIVRYLDHVDRRIGRYIRAKQKLIKLLEEQKQVIVNRAVTRGLDPGVRLKPSGVEWLGDVPQHWEVLPLRRHWTVTDCKHLTVPFMEEGIPLASVRQVQAFELTLTHAKRTTCNWYDSLIEGNRQPKRGDVIYCRNVSVGAAALVNTDERFAMGQDVCLVRSDSQNQRFLNYFLHSPAMKRQLATILVGSTFKRINVEEVKALLLAMPPRGEQDVIVDRLDMDLQPLEHGKRLALSQLELLREYRTRLIADVVTGKLDVREAAAGLPDDVEQPDLLSEDALETDEGDEEDELDRALETDFEGIEA